MTRYLLAGGGTAGHVNPLLAVADRLRRDDPTAEILVLGTKEGLEARLVPARGYELATIPKLPFPRRPNAAALRFPGAYRRTIRTVVDLIRERGIDAVVGFGGYAAAPAYSAARKAGVPLVIHEANARPGLGNRLGARYTPWVGVAFEGTRLPHATFVGMPLRVEIEELDRAASRPAALAEFGLSDDRPTLLVTGGSLGVMPGMVICWPGKMRLELLSPLTLSTDAVDTPKRPAMRLIVSPETTEYLVTAGAAGAAGAGVGAAAPPRARTWPGKMRLFQLSPLSARMLAVETPNREAIPLTVSPEATV